MSNPDRQAPIEKLITGCTDSELLKRLDDIARAAWAGDFERVGPLSSGERRYVALASGRMRELCPDDSIAYAVNSLNPGWFEHMSNVWRGSRQPQN